jgi:hypothetical protein
MTAGSLTRVVRQRRLLTIDVPAHALGATKGGSSGVLLCDFAAGLGSSMAEV